MISALQTTALPITGFQAPTLPTQAGTLPATTAAQLDITALMNMMILMMIVVMMMKMMAGATEKM